jgi:hypothetical protein
MIAGDVAVLTRALTDYLRSDATEGLENYTSTRKV